MDKTIGKWLSLLLLTLFAGNTAFAQKLSMEDFTIKAGETKEVTVKYEGTEAMYGYQTDITLSEGLSFEAQPAEKDAVFTATVTAKGTNTYRIASYDPAGATVAAGTEVVAFTVKAADDFTGGTIKLTHTEISFEGDNAVNPEDLTINVTVEKEPVVEGDKYALFTGDIEPGDYIIYYDGKAMNSTIATNRLQYEEVTPVDNAIVNPSADIVWTIAADGDYYTLYNAANEGYAASNGTRNQAAFATELSDNARWTVSGTETYEFVNVANSAAGVNANLRNNSTYGFACYSTGTGGALTLYKKVEAGEVVKPVLTESQNFDSPLTIEITAEDGADIYYTTDGSTPTESSTKYTEPFRVVETTTVNAIAVKGGVTSEVATATYTRVKPILISEAQALDAGSEAYIVGACVASAANGAVLYDGSDYIYYYNNANDLEVGKYYSVNGILSSYGGANQFTAAADVKEHAPADLIIPTDVTELTATDLDAAVEAKVVDPRQLASITGTLAISGNYVNLTVDGTESSKGSIVKPFEDISALDGKKVVVTGYEMYVNRQYVYFVATNIEEAPAPPVVEPGVYYLYNEASGKFLSRGDAWGTRAVVDDYGLPINLTYDDNGKVSLNNVIGGAGYGDDYWMYSDCSGDRARVYTIEEVEGGYAFVNPNHGMKMYVYLKDDADKYAVAGNAILNGNAETDNISDWNQTVWQLLTQAERDEIVNARIQKEIDDAFTAAGVEPGTKMTAGEANALTFKTGSAWTFTAKRGGSSAATNENGTETYQGTGSFTQSVTGLEAGLYKVTVQALYRFGPNAAVAENYDKGYNLSTAYLDANGSTAQVLSWGKDRAADDNPNNMEQAASLFADGKYINDTYAYVGEDGTLDLTVYVPSFVGYGWFIANEVTYAKAEEAPTFTVTVAEAEGGTVVADPAEAAEGETVALTVTPDENAKLFSIKATYTETSAATGETTEPVAEEKEVEITETADGYSFVMPAADVTVTAEFRTKNEPGEYDNTPLTKDMYKGWDDVDDYAKVDNETPAWDVKELPAEVSAGNTVYGHSTVACYGYADITGATTMRINGTPGVQLRVLMNREYQEDGQGPLTERQVTIGEDGYVDLDLSDLEYVHVNAIKAGWGSASGTIESIILNPSEETPEAPEILNPSFELAAADTPLTEELKASNGPLTIYGWTEAVDASFNNTEIRAAGSSSTTSQFGTAAPTDGEYALFFRHGWNGNGVTTTLTSAALSTLPAGSYKLSIDYKQHYSYDNTQNSNTTIGIAMMNGDTELGSAKSEGAAGSQGGSSDATYFNDSEWSTLTAAFTVEEDVEGATVVISFNAAGQRRSDYFIDNVKLELVPAEEVAKDALKEAIEAAQAKDYVIGDELFQYPEAEIEPLDQAIAAAQEVYDNEEATLDEINAATETLNNFIENFDPAYNEPEEGTPYIMTLTTSDGQFPLAIDGNANKIVDPEEDDATEIFFEKQEDGTWGMKTEDGDYIAYEGSNNWTTTTSTEPYGWTITALPDGGVSITGKNGLYGTNTSDGNGANSPIYADKNTSNGNYIWNIEPAEQEPEGTFYSGTLTQTLTTPDGAVVGEEVDNNYEIFISAPDPNNGVKIQFIEGFTFPVMGTVVPDLVVDAQMTTNEDGSITYSSEPFVVSVQRGMMTMNYNATLTGTQENADATPVITLVLAQSAINTVVFGPREEGVYDVTVDEDIENGTVTPSVETAKEGETIVITATPDEGYEISSVYAFYMNTQTEDDGTSATIETVYIEVTETADGYTFTMPAADVTVGAIFVEEQGLPDYVFVAEEWQAGDPARISVDNVTADADANTITVDKDGNQNVNLQFKGKDYNVPAENKYFVVQATGCTPDGAQLWWMNNDWIGTIQPEVYTVGDETLYAWPLEALKTNGGNGEPISLASDTDDATFTFGSQWSTCFGLTLADPAVPAIITNIGFTEQLPQDAVGINRISIDGADFAATIDNALRNGKVFDISGRKVSSVVKGGIYIVDGVKMVIHK